MDPYNESPWRYLIGVLNEQFRRDRNAAVKLAAEYETKAYGLGSVLVEAKRDPEACSNLTSARIDLLEMIGDEESLRKVC